MKTIKDITNVLGAILILSMLMISCEPDVDPDEDGNTGTGSVFTPDEFSSLLVFKDASNIQGDMPQGGTGNLKIDVKDTIFVAKGFSYGSRIRIKHDPAEDISGIYIQVPGVPSYYDVPVAESEDQDSVSSFYVNVDPDTDVECFFAMEVWFRPHDEAGNVLDEFIRLISIEEPCDNSCSITGETEVCNPNTGLCVLGPKWDWEFSYYTNSSGVITGINAPFLYTPSSYETSGCCIQGTSVYDITCASNPQSSAYRSLMVDNEYLASISETLRFDDNGTFYRTTLDAINDYNPDKSDFCNGIAGYDFSVLDFTYGGEYTFLSENAIRLKYIDYPQFSGIPAGWYNQGGEIVNTCHRLILEWGAEGAKFTRIYKLYQGDTWFE